MEKYTKCPKCDAETEKDAEIKCVPGGDDCPMCCEANWDDALERINSDNAEYERLAQEQYIKEMNKAYKKQADYIEWMQNGEDNCQLSKVRIR